MPWGLHVPEGDEFALFHCSDHVRADGQGLNMSHGNFGIFDTVIGNDTCGFSHGISKSQAPLKRAGLQITRCWCFSPLLASFCSMRIRGHSTTAVTCATALVWKKISELNFLSSNAVFFGEGLDRLESLSLTALALIALMQLPISFNFTVLECLVWFCRFFVVTPWYDFGGVPIETFARFFSAFSCLKLTVFLARLRPQCQASPNAACASLVPANSGSNANKWCSWCS